MSANPTAALTHVPPAVRAVVPDDLQDALAGLRPFDASAGTRVVAPTAARERVRGALLAAGYALAKEGQPLEEGTPAAGLSPDNAARFVKAALDLYQPLPEARPLHAVSAFLAGTRARAKPQALESLAESARARVRSEPGLLQPIERVARERSLEGIVLALEPLGAALPQEAAAFVRHRVAVSLREQSGAAPLLRVRKAASLLKADARAGASVAAREALGFAARLLLPGGGAVSALEGALARELDVFLADAFVAAATPATGSALDEPAVDSRDPEKEWPEEVARFVLALSRKTDAPLPRAPQAALAFARALAAFSPPQGRSRVLEASAVLGATGATAEQALALALAERHLSQESPVERRKHYRRFARTLDDAGRALVESAVPELAGADRFLATGLAAEAKASSRAELVSARRRACALALARTAEVSQEEAGPLRSELERARALLEAARTAAPAAPAQTTVFRGETASPFGIDGELVTLALEDALLAPDADRTGLLPRARAALERWAALPERAPLGFLGAALRLLASQPQEPFAGETKDPRRVEARILFHLARRLSRGAEPPRELVEALLERKRSGVSLSDLARKLDTTVTCAHLFANLPEPLAASLADDLGKEDELRLIRRIPGTDALLGRYEGKFASVRFYPEDDPPLERARALVNRGAGPEGVARPLAAIEASHVRGGLGVGWALVVAQVLGARLLPEDVPKGESAWGFLAALARAIGAQHAWGLVHGTLRLDAIVISGSGLALTDWDLEASLAPDAAQGRARDLEAVLAAAEQATGDRSPLARVRSHAGDLSAPEAASRLAEALDELALAAASSRSAFDSLRAKRTVDRDELRALLRDVLGQDGIPRSLPEVESRVPAYLPYRAAIEQETLRASLLELAEEGWASGEFALELDSSRGAYRIVEAAR